MECFSCSLEQKMAALSFCNKVIKVFPQNICNLFLSSIISAFQLRQQWTGIKTTIVISTDATEVEK